MLAVWENGFRHITNNVRPIVTPEDLAGIKLRTPSGEWRVKMFQAYGANPTPMSFSEVFTALQTGVVDGQENPLAQIYSAKFQEVQDYLSMTGHVYTPAYVLVGQNRWNSLPEDVRQILEETAKETQAFVYENGARLDTELLETIQAESDIEVNEADKDAFIAASDADLRGVREPGRRRQGDDRQGDQPRPGLVVAPADPAPAPPPSWAGPRSPAA